MNTRTLQLEFHDLWHVGSGRGRGAHLDAVVDRDEYDLPYVPGRMLKGVLRDAAERLAEWRAASTETEALLGALFGRPGHGDGGAGHGMPGVLHVSDARLPGDVAQWLASGEGKDYRERIFREHFSTRIDHASGTASQSSLRGIETVVPMTLVAEISIGSEPHAGPGFDLLRTALPLVRALGAHRNRGFGRVSLSFKESA